MSAQNMIQNINYFDNLWLQIKDKVLAGEGTFLENIYKEIYANFLASKRYMSYIKGLGVTLQVALAAALIGIILGTFLSLMRLSNIRILKKISAIYVNVIRGTPLLLQVLIFNFGFFGSIRLDKVFVGSIACGLNSAAYVAEIIRGGILSIDKGQAEAGRSLGLPKWKTMQLIVLPQTLKATLPALCNEFISLIKETSVLAYIALTDLTKASDYVRSVTYSPFTPYIIAALFYFIAISFFTFLLQKLERKLRQSDSG